MAHYDTPSKLPSFLSNLYKKYGLKYIAQKIRILLAIFVICFLALKYSLPILPHWIFPLLFYLGIAITFFCICLTIYILFLMLFSPNKINMNDNSSGVIAVLTIAKIIADKDKEMLKHIKIVFTDFEEYGLLGALILRIKLMFRRNLKEILIVNFDGVGQGSKLYLQSSEEDIRNRLVVNYLHEYNIIKEKAGAATDYDMLIGCNRIGISVLEKATKKDGQYYMPNIHTAHDTEIDQEQVAMISKDMARFVSDYIKSKRKNPSSSQGGKL